MKRKITSRSKTPHSTTAAATAKTGSFRTLGAFVLAAMLLLAFFVGFAVGCKKPSGETTPPPGGTDPIQPQPVTVNTHKNVTQVGYSVESVGPAQRRRPVAEVRNGGLGDVYPVYGYTKNLTTEQKNAVIAESNSLTANGTWIDVSKRTTGSYDKMDRDGYLYLRDGTPVSDSQGNHRQLYKHTSAAGMYLGDVSDDEPGVTKTMRFRNRTYGRYYNVTGLYAPAGEVIEIQMSKRDMDATDGIVIHIGQALYNGQANNIWAQKNINRMPVILNTMTVDKNTATYNSATDTYTAYVGSFLGGPLYIRGESASFTVTVTGAVHYSHFILGVTTAEEFEQYSQSSAPIFDLEVWDRGVLHSGPKRYAQPFGYEDLYKAAVLWEKITLVSTRRNNQGVVFLYDPFVAAGAAVAFPGRGSVNCPMDWMSGSLNYNGFVTSGAWGNMHEFHHNFQGFGCGGGDGEVTNNSLNLVSYSLFTKISAARQLAAYGGAGLSGWNCYTSATWALSRVNQGAISSTSGLAVYATLLHNFGQDAFISTSLGNPHGINYFKSWGNFVKHDMSYYASLTNVYTGANAYVAALHEEQKDYPMFVPVSSVYQTGRSYRADGQTHYIETQQPYVIPYGQSYTVDLSPYTVNAAGQYVSGSIVVGGRYTTVGGNQVPADFTYTIKNVRADGISGTFTRNDDFTYTFTPGSELRSGKIYVTLGVTKTDGAFAVPDVELVLEFQQSHETNKAILERTTYAYAAGAAYTDATQAYEAGYAGYTEKSDTDSVNPVQNSNTDVWYYPTGHDTQDTQFIVPENSVTEVRGKLYIGEEGKYRIALRGRTNCALYLSTDNGETFTLGGRITTLVNDSHLFRNNDPNTYTDLTLKADQWVYFKMVLINSNTPMTSYMGLGITAWTVPTFTIRTEEDAEGNVTTHYYDSNGHEVSAEEANNADPIAPTGMSYATAYRNSYEVSKEFTSDYFYTHNYNYNYQSNIDKVTDGKTQTLVAEKSNYSPWVRGAAEGQFAIEHLFDNDVSTNIHFAESWGVSEAKPAILTVDVGAAVTANALVLQAYSATSNAARGFPKNFTLEGSLDGETFFPMGQWTNCNRNGETANLAFSTATFRYYRLTVTASDNGRVALSGLYFTDSLTIQGNGANHISPDSDGLQYFGDWRLAYVASSFGHVYVGRANATMGFTFEGTRLMLLSSKRFVNTFEVYIDGEKVGSVANKTDDTPSAVTYLSPTLPQGKHTVVIKCLDETSIDSIATYTE